MCRRSGWRRRSPSWRAIWRRRSAGGWSWWREFDRRKAYEAWGCISCAYWLSWHCGLDLRSARDKVRVARALEDLPLICEKFAAGRISYSKVRAITRVATPATEEDLVMLAESSTGAQLERIAAAYRRGIDLEEERRGVQDRHAYTAASVLVG